MKFIMALLTISLISCTTIKGPKKFTKLENVFYTQDKIERQSGEVYIPEGAGPFPGVVLVHGGGWDSRSFEDMNSIADSLASHGYVVFNINYRFSDKDLHPAPIVDLGSALKHFKSKARDYRMDPKRIGLWGYSAGAHMVSYFALTHAQSEDAKVQAVVAGGSPFDFTWYPHSPIISKYMGQERDQMLEAYFEASPMYKITPEAPPFFLYHAKSDTLVEFAQSTAFEARLRKNKTPVELHAISWWGHGTAFVFSKESVKKGIKFLDKTLN